jgi:hypothetical protein
MLRRLDLSGFDDLCQRWDAECRAHGELFADFDPPHISHARSIVSEPVPDKKYGIFALDSDGRVDAIMHVNRANLPRTKGFTLRVNWVMLAPRFEFSEVSESDFARIAADIIYGSLLVSEKEMKCENVKIRMANLVDRKFFLAFEQAFQRQPEFSYVGLQGGWFHLSRKKVST